MDERCETCRWWTRNKQQPVAPLRTHGKFLWFTYELAGPDADLERILFESRTAPNHLGICRRMPNAMEKREDDFCGEHTPRTPKGADHDL